MSTRSHRTDGDIGGLEPREDLADIDEPGGHHHTGTDQAHTEHGHVDHAGRHGDEVAERDLPTARGGKVGSIWVVLALGAVVTILLLVSVLQNLERVTTRFLGWEFSMPLGVVMLFAAIAGALIMALFAGVRILQLRLRARKVLKTARGR